jgi:uncharacterized protein (DUF1800 family)
MLREIPFAMTAVLIASALPASAAPPQTFATAYVQAAAPRGAVGRDAGVDVSQGRYVRVTASGTFSSRYGACGTTVGPNGCGGNASPTAAGTLLAAFADNNGRMETSWMPVGQFANLAVPSGAKRLLFRVNGLSGREFGAYRVVADVVPNASPAQLGSGPAYSGSRIGIGPGATSQSSAIRIGSSGVQVASATIGGRAQTLGSATSLGTVQHGPSSGVLPSGTAATRSDVHYALRRLGFSDTPANVTNVLNTGVATWVAKQLQAPSPDSDSSIVQGPGGNVEALPVLTGTTADGNYQQNIEDRLMQWQVNTQWQLREKITLHWLEHFAVSYQKVNQPADMEHYIQTVRYDALGNYAKLIADVAKEPAMLIWLDNANNGYNPNTPPNENFGREVMQLYTIGLNTLNPDGTIVQDPNNPGEPLATYQEQDVKNMALALTGFQLQQAQAIGTYPAYVDNVSFNAAAHCGSMNSCPGAANGGFSVMGQKIPDGTQCTWSYTQYKQSGLNTACVMDNVALNLASNPTTWSYEAAEMIERLVNETPSPAFVKRISTVWGKTVNDSNQIAEVVSAIANDPEFYAGKYTMVKEPIEYEVDAIRALGGANTNPITSTMKTPLTSAISDTARMAQEIWDPPSVFSFYYPGQKEHMINNAQMLSVWSSAADLAGAAQTKACPTCTIDLDFSTFATATQTNDLAGYLLDALVDGGTPQLNALVRNYLNNKASNVQGAVWIILSSPEYGVN